MTGFSIVNSLRAVVMGAFLALLVILPAHADPVTLPDRVLGSPSAPVTVEEFVSLTCPHCGDFYLKTLPDLEKKYVDTGKVKFILRDFPLDAISLKAASLARCMPADEFYPFVTVLYQNQASWAVATDAEHKLVQYATLGGLDADKAKTCLNDSAMQDAVAAERTDATNKYNVESTPTFVINGGAERIDGARPAADFAAAFDKLLAQQGSGLRAQGSGVVTAPVPASAPKP